jgi:hypothetical protein
MVDGGVDEYSIVFIVGHVHYEGAVDFERIERQFLQIGEEE